MNSAIIIIMDYLDEDIVPFHIVRFASPLGLPCFTKMGTLAESSPDSPVVTVTTFMYALMYFYMDKEENLFIEILQWNK